mgnify:CR=1 FL=1
MPEFFGQLPAHLPEWRSLVPIQQVQSHPKGIDCLGQDARLSVRMLAPNLVRVQFTPVEGGQPRRSWAVTKADEEWEATPFTVKEEGTIVELHSDRLRVVIDLETGRVGCVDAAGRPFAQDVELGMGWRSHTLPPEAGVTAEAAAWKRVEPGEHFYALGERTGLLAKTEKVLTHWTWDAFDHTVLDDMMYQSIPFLIGMRPGVGYGLFFNSTYWSQFDLETQQSGVLQLLTHGADLDYYIIYGPEPAQIVQTYTELTGRMPLPPRWALGYHQCRWSYSSEEWVRQVAREFRDRQIPCDVIHLDIDYMQNYRVFTWNRQHFPDPKTLTSDLSEAGFKVVTIVDPGVMADLEDNYKVFDDGLVNNCFVRKPDGKLFHGYVWPDRAVFPDFMNPDVREWWGNWHERLLDVGVAGIWNDMNEPALDDRPFGDGGKKITFPLNTCQGPVEEPATHAETHNLYGLMMCRASREGMERLRPQQRPFLLTRSGYSGIQCWSAVWTGDNQSLWEYLEMSMPMLCNLGLSGIAFVGADIGGFAGNATPELFARWMQLGILYPFMRAHSIMGSKPHEPWAFGETVERICREYITLRYRLLPYLYTLFWEAAQTGAPILRPLIYHYPNDPQTYSLHDQVMLGAALMAAPVYRPGVVYRAVYLPEGVWYDWWTGDRHIGPSHILASAPLERMPLYQRAGTVVALREPTPYVDAEPMAELWLRVAPGYGTWTFYEDDGSSFEYQQGAWATTQYTITTSGTRTTVDIHARNGNYMPHPRTVIVEVLGRGEQRFENDGSDRRLIFE